MVDKWKIPFKKYSFIVGLTLVILFSVWFGRIYVVNAEVDSTGPEITAFSTQPKGTIKLSELQVISFRFNDYSGLDTNMILQVDGVDIPPSILWDESYQTENDTVSGTTYEIQTGDDHTKGMITAQLPPLSSGQHEFYYSVKDTVGNLTEGSFMFTLQDDIAPAVIKHSPFENVTIITNTPTIGIKISDASKIVTESVYMDIDGNPVPAVFDRVFSLVRYIVTQPMPNGNHSVRLTVSDEYGNTSVEEWSFKVSVNDSASGILATEPDSSIGNLTAETDSAFGTVALTSTQMLLAEPLATVATGLVISELTPAPDSTTNVAAPKLSFRFSTPNKLKSTVILKIDDQNLTPTIKWDDLFETRYDSCGNPYMVKVGYDYRNGTVTAQLPQLSFGQHAIYYKLTDLLGNVTENNYTFTFSDNVGPQFSEKTPVDWSVTANSKPVIKVKLIDTSPIAAASISMKLNGSQVMAIFDPISSYLTYTVPQPLINGTYQVEVSASDTFNNNSIDTWRFTVKDDTPPTITDLVPANNSGTASSNPTIEAKASDVSGITNPVYLQIDGNNFEVQYLPQTGKVSYVPVTPLSQGKHNVNMYVYDLQGNKANASWAFSVYQIGPEVSELTPAPGSLVANIRNGLSFKVSTPYKLNSNVVVKFDNQSVTPTIKWDEIFETRYDSCGEPYTVKVGDDYTKASVTVQLPKLSLGQHTVYYKLTDYLGNITEKNYSFTVSDTEGPQISNLSPAGGAVVSDGKPTISAKLNDSNLIVADSVYLIVNGERVNSSYNVNTKTVTYQPVQQLINGENNIQVAAKDELNNASLNSWKFTVNDMSSPVISLLTPAPQSVINDSKPVISAKFTDSNMDYSTITLMFNGKAVGSVDPTTGIVTYKVTSPLASGTYNVEASGLDRYGNRESINWSFTVKDAGSISNLVPLPGIGIQSLRPKISADVIDSEGIDTTKITLTVDGLALNANFKPLLSDSMVAGTVYGVPDMDLSNAMHTATITIVDMAGNSQQRSWQFGINTVTNLEQCSVCHTDDQNTLAIRHLGEERCWVCHENYSPEEMGADCTDCHEHTEASPPNVSNVPCTQCHNSASWDVVPTHSSPTEVAKHNTLLGQECLKCHQSDLTKEHSFSMESSQVSNCLLCHGSSDSKVKTAISTNNAACSACHGEIVDHELLHESTVNSRCSGCHLENLIGEHLTSRPDLGLNCDSCHDSTVPAIQTAIDEDNLECTACHGADADHVALHTSGLDSNCIGCHSENLAVDHTTKRPQFGLSCKDCHPDSDSTVSNRVYMDLTNVSTENMLCSQCHSEGHNMKFTPTKPSDIPLYPEIEWSSPIDSRIFNEPWMPEEFSTDAKLLISQRDNSISGDGVWSYYRDEMTSRGWILISPAPSAQSDYFDVTFNKNGRKARISFYGGENHTASPVVSTGYRVEILYK